MNVAELTAIDVHVHVHGTTRGDGHRHAGNAGLEAMAGYFKTENTAETVPQIAAHYRERKMAAIVFTVDVMAASADGPVPGNIEIAELAAEHADVLIPFASIDPARGKEGVRLARELVEQYGVRGFKFHPSSQGFFPNDPAAYPLYEVLAEHNLVALFHSGHTGVGAGVRGGAGVRLKYSNPMHVDDVAVDFPDLKIILAHPSFPWQDEALSVALHKPLVHIDLSGWSPKYFDPKLVQYANTLLKDKFLFGSDFPLLTPDRWLADFAAAPFRDDVRPLILRDNAIRLLGLSD